MFYVKRSLIPGKIKLVFYCNKNVTVDVKFIPCRDNDGKFNQENGRDLSVVLWRWPLGFIRTHREKHETIVVIIHTNTHKLKHINSKAILINII